MCIYKYSDHDDPAPSKRQLNTVEGIYTWSITNREWMGLITSTKLTVREKEEDMEVDTNTWLLICIYQFAIEDNRRHLYMIDY
jgi:hypothetical protein